ncbi:Protein STRUBBELIG-RECEPTOR FAMILY 2 [Acorus calamus]|uniref:Protein STRUBBELIG-RECEPTOR FAMILY 2 n=1 Tax=Acorus calamus TaxID=4465 RepID=A0AAV9C131_ACOCL|nr:Protein STRUBBELIG-RECEPTOR FAMILY 2 [Acorus calamus]
MLRNDKRKWTPGATAGIAVTAVLLAGAVASYFLIKLHSAHKHRKDRSNGAKNSLYSLPITMPRVSKERPPDSFVTHLWHPPLHQIKPDRTSRRKSCSEGNGILLAAKLYFASDLLAATNNFGDENLIGEGSLGRVYRAKLPDDQVVAVKKIDMADLALCEEDEFLELISNSSHLRHPNITCLLGYCVDQGLYALLYEYVGHGTLSDALHFSNDNSQIPLSWKRRMSIAHGVTQALEYLHCTSSPPVAHGNLKAANVLLDDKLIPHLSDCGLTGLRPYTGFKSKIPEIPIHGKGYNAPESSIPGSDKTKSEVYSFGVMLLELLTGKNALDSSIDGEEQSLVEWASSRLQSMTLLEEIVDPAIRGTIPKKGLSFFADIVSRCTQAEPELRPQMPEITDLLVQLVQRTSFSDVEGQADLENELSNQSFWTTYSHFDQGPLPPAI